MMRVVRANVPHWLVAINITESWTYTAHQHTRLSVNVQVEPPVPWCPPHLCMGGKKGTAGLRALAAACV